MMIMGFPQLLAFVSVLLVFALAIIVPFVWFLHYFLKKRAESDRERSEACHNFQRQLNEQTMIGFRKNYEALSLNTQVLTVFMQRMDATKPETPKGP